MLLFGSLPPNGHLFKLVMPGLEPGIHVLLQVGKKDVDGRDRPGHDERRS
jgi:hypothetical protein